MAQRALQSRIDHGQLPNKAKWHDLRVEMSAMTRTKPPFRADHVGSSLRTGALKEARAKREQASISDAELKAVEDREIQALIAKQEEVGLKLATDGEFRRAFWHFDFYGQLEGVALEENEQGIQFKGVQSKPQSIRVMARSASPPPPDARPFQVFQGPYQRHAEDDDSVADGISFPARAGRGRKRQAYAEIDDTFDDLAEAYRKRGQGVLRRRLPLSAIRRYRIRLSVLARRNEKCQVTRHQHRSRPGRLCDADRHTIADKPADMVITTHVCRGNFRSTWISEGGYEPVAERLLGSVNYDGYFLEYDTDRAGGFEPLRFLPKGNKIAVLGLVTSKTGHAGKQGRCQAPDRRGVEIRSARPARASPQCGFASTEEGNVLTEDQQWAKMREIVEIAEEVWG